GSDGRRYEKRVDARGRESEPVCIEDEIPFEIPEGWAWARLGAVSQISGGGTPDKSNPRFWNGDISWASVKDLKGDYLTGTIDHISQEGLLSKASISRCVPGDLIVATRLVPGKSILCSRDSTINQDLKRIRSHLDIKYLHLWFQFDRPRLHKLGQGTTVPGIKLSDLTNALIPVPPLVEQQRIVRRFTALYPFTSQ
ncbi:restriction endonuclease subunit S, partial [Collinsella intestinalis]|uniref:restriction endonuclease subunit S n=1 Tax=Collinsella intestinalis TaxID=147207 RepID=UPI001959C953